MERTFDEKKTVIQRAYSLGFEYEQKYRGCSQCTLAAIQDALDVRNDMIFKAGSGLASGGGLMCDGVCGGYSGGVMMMSTFFGRRRDRFDDDREEKYCAFRMAKALQEKFAREYGSIICKEIHIKLFNRTFDLWDANEKAAFEQAGAHADKCTSVVANASAWATELILEELSKRGLAVSDLQKRQQ